MRTGHLPIERGSGLIGAHPRADTPGD